MDAALAFLNHVTSIPKIIFPGNTDQLNNQADALLYLSLISGRNPDLLIGKHIDSIPFLRESKLEILPTGYILIDGGTQSTVATISNTTPISSSDLQQALHTALAGQYLGMQFIYLEAGSGAKHPVPKEMIQLLSTELDIPLIVGGGIRNPEAATT